MSDLVIAFRDEKEAAEAFQAITSALKAQRLDREQSKLIYWDQDEYFVKPAEFIDLVSPVKEPVVGFGSRKLVI